MQRDLGAYLWDMAKAIGHIQSFTAGMSYEEYIASSLVQSAVEREFEIIGEAMK
jgi:uncharacterized protein with HEPN domain